MNAASVPRVSPADLAETRAATGVPHRWRLGMPWGVHWLVGRYRHPSEVSVALVVVVHGWQNYAIPLLQTPQVPIEYWLDLIFQQVEGEPLGHPMTLNS